MYESCTRRRWKRRYQILFQLITHLLPNVRFAYKFWTDFCIKYFVWRYPAFANLGRKSSLACCDLLWLDDVFWGKLNLSWSEKKLPLFKKYIKWIMHVSRLKKKGSGAGGGLGITFHGLVLFWSTCWASLRVIFLTKDWALKDTSTFRAGTSNCKLKLRKVLCSSAAWTNWINLSSFKMREVVFCHVPVLIS